ncbi:ABC nitrate/sulfonate/bicarbonate transporter, periplasmic ligand binding protein [Methylobacterium sp. 4-46]|uniref:ABC transporter substrate-binding protein n=1 Tax=unclassified Methylobacterium TaxID=2615210 RepID=UPI000152DED8|nr:MULTISPECIES: ABC transporter substrate-binding protein [Methylobacterium]ACA18848.1 ABC nitrate/sulfonate/bicarbonate transporter, periplasmic ligand binding protein [Methylobacterium sp. 4-46]WFT78073.1 ABC transporter substrate-binding protein [Methylobacterium nodulans]
MLTRLAALAAFIAAWAGPASAEDVVRLGNLKFAHYGAISYMKEIAPKYGIRIDEKVFAKGADIYPAMAVDQIDISASGADGAVAARGNGVKLLVVAGFANGGVRILGRPDLGAKTLADIKGKKVATVRGGTQDLMLLAELEKNGLTWSDRPGKDVQLIYFNNYADLNQALAQKYVDVICQSEPQSTQAISAGWGTEIVKPYDTPVGIPYRPLVMTEKMYAEKPDVAARVLKVFVEATKTFIEKPDLAEKYVREQVFKGQLSSQDYKDAMTNAAFTYDIPAGHMQVTADLMHKYGLGKMVSPPKSDAEWVKLDLLEKAKAELGAKTN